MMSARTKGAALYAAAFACAAVCHLTQVDAQQPGLPYQFASEGAVQSSWLTGSATWKLTELSEQDGAGSISVAAGSTTVIGTGTFFTSELQVGQRLLTAADVYLGKVLAINSDTSVLLEAPSAAAASGAWQVQSELVHDYVWDAATGNSYWAISDDDCTLDHYLTINNASGVKTTYQFETLNPQCAQPYLENPCKHLKPDGALGEKPFHVYDCNNAATVTMVNGRPVLSATTSGSPACSAPFTGYTAYDVDGQAFKTQYPNMSVPAGTEFIYGTAGGDSVCVCTCPYTQQDKSDYIAGVLRELHPDECEVADYVDTMLVTPTASGPKQTHTYVGTYAASATSAQKFRFFLIGDNVADPTAGDVFDPSNPTLWWDDYYVETNTGPGGSYVPFSLAGYKVQSFAAGLPQWQDYAATATTAASPLQPWTWELPYGCNEDLEANEDIVTTAEPALPSATASLCECPTATNNPSQPCCLAYNYPQLPSWSPNAAERQVKSWHSDNIIWNNNGGTNTNTNGGVDWNDVLKVVGFIGVQAASLLGPWGYWAAKGLNAALQLASDGIPQNRLWGTNWCARGNEFTARARLAKGKANDFWGRDNTNKVYGNPCTGESPKNGAAIASGHYPGSKLVTVRDTYKHSQTKIERKKRKNLTLYNALKTAVAPAALKDYTIGPSVRQDSLSTAWAAVELPNANVFNAAGTLTQAAQRLTRCRAVPNLIDTDFSIFTGGLQSVGRILNTGGFPTAADQWGASKGTIHGKNNLLSFDAEYYGLAPYFGVVAKRAFDNVAEVAVTHECGTNGCANFDTWCRQHDIAPISYTLGNKKGSASSKGTCHADGRGLFAARQYNSNYPFIKFANMLFGTFGQQPCLALKLKCLEKKKGKCKNFGLKWKKSWGGKYKASAKEGKKFSGPIGRNDLFTESICATLRTPGEGVDGSVVPRIGNGVCNCEYNNEWHGYDGGDCCAETCRRPNPKCYQTTGTITVAAGTPTIVTGSGTSFITQFKKGHVVYTITAGGALRKIGTVSVNPTSNTQLKLTAAATAPFVTGSTFVVDPNNNVASATCTHPDVKCDLTVTGTITVKAASTGVIGNSNTFFLQWFAPGHQLRTASGLVVGTIASIQTNAALTLTAIPSAAIQSALSTPQQVALDPANSPFLGFHCKQPGCTASNGSKNVSLNYKAAVTANYLQDGRISKTFNMCTVPAGQTQ